MVRISKPGEADPRICHPDLLVDLPSSDIERVTEEIEAELGLDVSVVLLCSVKEGTGIEDILEAITERIPPPRGGAEEPLAALIYDACYDTFRGTIVSCRIFNGSVRPGDVIRLMSTGSTYTVEEVGYFRLVRVPQIELVAGEVGYIIACIKTVSDTRIGDTITLHSNPAAAPLPGFKDVKPVVFSSLYPISSDDYPSLVDALEKY